MDFTKTETAAKALMDAIAATMREAVISAMAVVITAARRTMAKVADAVPGAEAKVGAATDVALDQGADPVAGAACSAPAI